jgi:hypothetical protein
MLPLGVPSGFALFLPLFAADFFAQSLPTSFVCVADFFDGGAAALDFEAAFLGADFAAMLAMRDGERGGEGARPVEGASRANSGSVRLSRGFLNMEEGENGHLNVDVRWCGVKDGLERLRKERPIALIDRAVTCRGRFGVSRCRIADVIGTRSPSVGKAFSLHYHCIIIALSLHYQRALQIISLHAPDTVPIMPVFDSVCNLIQPRCTMVLQ